MSKRKSSGDRAGYPSSLELDEEQIAALELMSDSLDPSMKCLGPVLDAMRKACSDVIPPHKRVLPTRQATDFKATTAAARALGIDFKRYDSSYVFNLKTEYLQDSGQLSEDFASVIKYLQTSDYVSARNDESFSRTILDLIVIDRLRHLEDKDAYHRLQLAAEVPVSVRIKDAFGNSEIVKGRADWALGYGTEKSNTGAILLIIEAKPYDSAPVGMPQLLVYMAGVYEARTKQDRVNKGVFGMVSDSKEFRFAFLNEEKKLFTSKSYDWAVERSKIIAYIDMMLINAIESSPHTTPQKKDNKTIHKYPQYLESKWRFGTASDDEGSEEEEEEEEEEQEEEQGEEDPDMVDVLKIAGRIVMRVSKRHGQA